MYQFKIVLKAPNHKSYIRILRAQNISAAISQVMSNVLNGYKIQSVTRKSLS